jgi:hypothetical protein
MVLLSKSPRLLALCAPRPNGLEFWIGKSNGQIERATTSAAPSKPFWMWLTGGSKWNTFDSTGALLGQPNLFGRNRGVRDLPTPKPPKWLTDGYYVAAPAVF